MWLAFRPDAQAVLKDERARRTLGRYFAVMNGSLPSRARLCALTEVEVDLSADERTLWKAHERGLKRFRSLLAEAGGSPESEMAERPETSLLDLKVELARRILKSCRFCERRCGADRINGQLGVCGVGATSRLASEFMHHGEEPELVPSYTLFFSGCTFKCQFCQNWDISQYPDEGAEVTPAGLAKLVKRARESGARNVNWVGGDPTPNLHVVLETLRELAVNIPSVWNSNMYLSVDAMHLLFGTQDIYLTDFKYGNDECALRLSKVKNYFDVVSRNHRLAFADSEMIIRHLVMPNHIECCTRPVLEWIADNLGPMVRVNLMNQYRPCYKAGEHGDIDRPLTAEEFSRALEIAEEAGLENVIT